MHTENIDDTNNPSDNTLEIDTNVEQSETIAVSPRRSTRSRRPLAYLQDFDVPNLNNNIVSTKYSIHSFLNYNSLSKYFKNTIMLITSTEEPQNYEEAVLHPSWIQAMKDELEAL